MGRITEIRFVTEAVNNYPIAIQPGLSSRIGVMLQAEIGPDRDVVIVTDDGVPSCIVQKLRESLANAGWTDVPIVVFPAGEPSKSFETFDWITARLIELGVNRRSVLVALGGGVVSDTVGYVAASLMRGLEYVIIPTTLIGQLDAAVGGKVAVNHPCGKNLIGAFWHPQAVFIDPRFLQTLPLVEIRNGLAEAVKVAIIDCESLFLLLEEHSKTLTSGNLDIDRVRDVIELAVAKKVELLMPDPFESCLRRVLNLGHTFAHALETRGAYSLRHGFAVALGIAVSTRISMRRQAIDPSDAERIANLLKMLGLPAGRLDIDPAELWHHTRIIRKIRGNSINYVMPTSIRSVAIVDDLSFEEFSDGFMSLETDTEGFQQAYLSVDNPA